MIHDISLDTMVHCSKLGLRAYAETAVGSNAGRPTENDTLNNMQMLSQRFQQPNATHFPPFHLEPIT